MKYFLHDTNAFQDEKITELFIGFGYEGVGLFYTILEKLAMQEKPIKTEVLKKQLFIGRKLNKCWEFLESSGLISSNNGETFNENLLKFSEKFQVKKEKNRERISKWRENQALSENVTRYESVCNSPKDNISKVKVNKDISSFQKRSKRREFKRQRNLKLSATHKARLLLKRKKLRTQGGRQKSKLHYFEESPYYPPADFAAAFTPEHFPIKEYPNTNLKYYYEKVLRWAEYGSGKKPGKQKSKDWLATTRTFIMRDMDEGGIKQNGNQSQPKKPFIEKQTYQSGIKHLDPNAPDYYDQLKKHYGFSKAS